MFICCCSRFFSSGKEVEEEPEPAPEAEKEVVSVLKKGQSFLKLTNPSSSSSSSSSSSDKGADTVISLNRGLSISDFYTQFAGYVVYASMPVRAAARM